VRQNIFTKARQIRTTRNTTSWGTPAETVRKVDGGGPARERENEERSRAGADPTRGERSSSAWRELELDF